MPMVVHPVPSQLTEYPEDELISLDELQEQIGEFEDFVQSTDIAAMQSKWSPKWEARSLLTIIVCAEL